MGTKQETFLTEFQSRFDAAFGNALAWTGGQVIGNKANFCALPAYRRDGVCRPNEGIELGDLRTSIAGWTIVVEYESEAMVVQNLIKYWPYLRGELSVAPHEPIILVHFSDWKSWGSFRDLWDWIRKQMSTDTTCKVSFTAEQYDHGGGATEVLSRNAEAAIAFVRARVSSTR